MRRRCYALFVALFSVHPLGREHWMSKEGASHRTPTPAHLHGPSCPFFKPLLIPPPWRPPTSHFFYPPSSCIKPFSFFVCFLYITLPSGSQLLRSQCRFASWPQPDYQKYASTAASALVLLSFRSAAQKTRHSNLDSIVRPLRYVTADRAGKPDAAGCIVGPVL